MCRSKGRDLDPALGRGRGGGHHSPGGGDGAGGAGCWSTIRELWVIRAVIKRFPAQFEAD